MSEQVAWLLMVLVAAAEDREQAVKIVSLPLICIRVFLSRLTSDTYFFSSF
jgi:hypothetical protein